MNYTTAQIEAAINGKKNATAKSIRLMTNGAQLELTQTQLNNIKATGIIPTLVGHGLTVNVHVGFRPVYRGNNKGIYTIEMA